ncbi:MAG: VWA domain-containing protein [Phycisphaerae bacterium]
MTFLEPVNLALLGLLAVIALAYLLRMPRRRLRVPDAGVARAALADSSRINRQKRTLVSLAIQVVILALLAAAAALPFLGDGRREERSLVVLLDVSASMRADDTAKFRVLTGTENPPPAGPTRFAKAMDAVRGLARGMTPGDRMMLMTVGRTVDVAFNFQGDQDVIAHALDVLAAKGPSAEEARFADACAMAAEIAQSRRNVEVVLVTDGAVRSPDLAPLANLASSQPAGSAGTPVVKLVNVGHRSGNLGITGFHVRKNLDSPTDYEALVSLVNTFDEPRKVEVELLLGGAVFDIAPVDVAPGAEAVQVFREKLHIGGVLEARLRVVDALADDNVAWEILRPPNRLRVLLVSDDSSPSSFLVRAVGSNAGAVEGMVITPEQYRQAIAANPGALRDQRDAVVFDRWVPDKPEELPPTHIMAIDCVPPGMPASAGETFDKPLIRKWEQGHPLMSYLNLRNVFISAARRVSVSEPAKGQRPVERVAEMVTSPLVLAWERPMPNGNGGANPAASRPASAQAVKPQRFVVLGFNPRDSDIVLRKELPLLLWNSFLWFSDASEPPTQVAPGGTIRLPSGESADARSASVTSPDGRVETVPIDAAAGDAYFAGTAAPGVYRYRIGKAQGSFAVNCGSAGESDVRPTEDMGFKPEALDAAKLAAVAPGGRRLWPYLLVAVAVLLAFEAVVFHRRIYF